MALYAYPAALTTGCTTQACDFRDFAYGAYGEKQLFGKTLIGVIWSTFVIDALGVIEQAMYTVKATGQVAKLHRDLGL